MSVAKWLEEQGVGVGAAYDMPLCYPLHPVTEIPEKQQVKVWGMLLQGL